MQSRALYGLSNFVCDTCKGNSHHSSPQTKKNILSVSIVCLLLELPRIHGFQLLRNHLRAVAYSKFANKTLYNFGVMLAISWHAYSPHGSSKVCTVLLGNVAHTTHVPRFDKAVFEFKKKKNSIQ